MSNISNEPSGLEDRFTQPEGWRWGTLRRDGRTIRYGVSFPKGTTPDAVVVCLPGLSEFGEKYFELARDLNGRNMAFWVLDWHGQGKSTRYFENAPHKRHSAGIQSDIDDLHALYLDYIKHSSVHPDVGRIPRAMIAHSMGGNIGLRYLEQHPDTFDCALFTAPLFGLHATKALPNWLAKLILKTCTVFAGKSYASDQQDWRAEIREAEKNIFSTDPVRSLVHNAWSVSEPALQVGGVTWRWLYEIVKSCTILQTPKFLRTIQTHCVIALAGEEELVDNDATMNVAAALPHARTMEFPGASHELLMESDSFRAPLLDAFQNLVKERIIDNPEALKTF